MNSLEKKFNRDLQDMILTCKRELGYNPSRFIQLASEIGYLQAARQVILKEGATYGFEILWENNRLDLSIEAYVLKPEYKLLFTEEEKRICRERLLEFGYKVDSGNFFEVEKDMRNYEKIAEACKDLTIGEIYSTAEIKKHILSRTDVNEDNILPSDYCYNITNKGADGNRFIIWPRLFEFVDRGLYNYLGEGYPYTGKVIYSKTNELYGYWTNGQFKRA